MVYHASRKAASLMIEKLEAWKREFGGPENGTLERLLGRAAQKRFRDAGDLIRLHETLLFLRAYPRTPAVARLTDEILSGFVERVAEVTPDSFEDPTISGIAGTSIGAVFSYKVARSLYARHGGEIDIAWDRYDEIDRMGPVVSHLIPLLREDWPVEAHVPIQKWVPGLGWLLSRLKGPDAAERYDSMSLPLEWKVAPNVSRSMLRLPRHNLFCHTEPLIRRTDVSLARELAGPRILVHRVSRSQARTILHLIMDTSAMRYRELYGFSHPEEGYVHHANLGRGVEIYFFGVPPKWRLPLRAYHAGMFFKNGVPAGYVELLSLFERAEVGFNVYYTFREGESAWLYVRLLHLFRQELGVNVFSVDPYQIGHENPEAIESGAFWFYRKLGFRPVDPDIAALTAREESRMQRTPGYRSSPRLLKRLASGPIVYEGPGAELGVWDRFNVHELALSGRIPGAAKIGAAKQHGSEAQYLRMLQRDRTLRARFLAYAAPLVAKSDTEPRP
jgi:hypothetical protein